jgi:hypothetical protein
MKARRAMAKDATIGAPLGVEAPVCVPLLIYRTRIPAKVPDCASRRL